MTATASAALDQLSLPRRVAIARVLTDALATERGLAELYATFAVHTPLAPLRAAFGELAQAKAARVAMLEGLLGSTAPPPRAPFDVRRASREEVFARAFQAERELEVGYREVGALLGEAATLPGLRELLTDATRHRELVRHLYVRYS